MTPALLAAEGESVVSQITSTMASQGQTAVTETAVALIPVLITVVLINFAVRKFEAWIK